VTWIGYRWHEFLSGLLFVTADTLALMGRKQWRMSSVSAELTAMIAAIDRFRQ
jgi:hypothetical protein